MQDVKEQIADEAKKIVGGARRSAYGKPERNFERIARLWNVHLENTGRAIVRTDDAPAGASRGARLTPTDVATFCRFIKEARLAETPGHRDSFIDIVGYTLCQAEIALSTNPTNGAGDTGPRTGYGALDNGPRIGL